MISLAFTDKLEALFRESLFLRERFCFPPPKKGAAPFIVSILSINVIHYQSQGPVRWDIVADEDRATHKNDIVN